MKHTLLINKETNERSVRNNKTGELVYESVDPDRYSDLRKKALASQKRRDKDETMRSLGLTKVKGAVSGKTYWE